MNTETRKQREIRHREAMFLDVARQMLSEQGFAGLNMDRVSEATEYSKGTIYQHFASKEDLVTALACQSMQCRASLFQRVAGFDGRPREKILALGVAEEQFVRRCPDHFRNEQIIFLASLANKARPERFACLQQQEESCCTVAGGIVREALDRGDLRLPPERNTADVVLGLAGLTKGIFTAIASGIDRIAFKGVSDPYATFRFHLQAFLDGLNWQPLQNEFDYRETYHRIETELFAEDCAGQASTATEPLRGSQTRQPTLSD